MIVGAHGLRGGLKIKPFSDHSPDWWSGLPVAWLLSPADKAEPEGPFKVRGVGHSAHGPRIDLGDIKDRNKAEALKGFQLLVEEGELPALTDGQMYQDDLAEALSTARLENAKGEVLGQVEGILENPAHLILEVRKPDGTQILVPLVNPCFNSIVPEDGVLLLTDEEWFHAL